ncbi:MAG: ribosome biogenesis GTPase Der, partial [Clostridia bacterium]|nr:ribosome biogenesis GTPase Der [Clostridia bacterium]
GGIEPYSKDIILEQMRLQAELAIDMADVIIFMTDIRDGLTATDHEVCTMLQKSGKPVVLAVNKADTPGEPPLEFYEFYNLGIGDPIPISSLHKMGVGDVLDECVKYFPDESEEDDDDTIKIAIVGKPNAGKSSLVNKILGENRVIVSNIAGTTRDAIDTAYERDGVKYTLIDTAGIRRKVKITDSLEHYSVVRAIGAIERCDACIIMIDAEKGITEQDAKIAGYAHDEGKASIVCVNKWDAIEKDDKSVNRFTQEVRDKLSFMTYAPVLFISALTGQRVDKIFDLITLVTNQNSMRLQTGVLNDVLSEAVMRVQPPSDKGKRLKIYYMTQVSVKPPTFVLFVNDQELAHFSYVRYIENCVREAFNLNATPLRFIVRERSKQND